MNAGIHFEVATAKVSSKWSSPASLHLSPRDATRQVFSVQIKNPLHLHLPWPPFHLSAALVQIKTQIALNVATDALECT